MISVGRDLQQSCSPITWPVQWWPHQTVHPCVMGCWHMLGGMGRETRINSMDLQWHRTFRQLTAEERSSKNYWFESVTPQKLWYRNSSPTRRCGWRSPVLSPAFQDRIVKKVLNISKAIFWSLKTQCNESHSLYLPKWMSKNSPMHFSRWLDGKSIFRF